MSLTKGSFVGLIKKAATGKGKGAQVVDKSSVEEDANFMHSMYQKDGTQNSKEEESKQHELRRKNAQKYVDSFYNIVTDFYESGWGQSFHFAPRGKSESFSESIARHEYFLAMKANIQEDDYCLDMGCGIGGPMRNIHQFTNARILGITINDYQVNRGNAINREQLMEKKCQLKTMDYMNMTFSDNTFDKAFAIESTCHAEKRTSVFSEAYRILKPGGIFITYEWVINSNNYNPENDNHVRIIRDVEKGNALPKLITEKDMLKQMEEVGFEILEEHDVDLKSRARGQLPWYYSMEAKFTLENIHHTYFGTLATHYLCWALEKVGFAPKGTLSTHEILLKAKNALIEAGRAQIFTPMYLVVARKPSANAKVSDV